MRMLAALVCLALVACNEVANDVPRPIAMTEEALGYYCQMNVAEHDGPKGQIHLAGFPMPIWFAQVRDGIAYVKSQERSADILAFYVNDMGAAPDWREPGSENWIDANAAYFVVGSKAVGGMGAPELVPFADPDAASDFAQRKGGAVKRLSEIDPEEVLAPVDVVHVPEPTS